MAELDTLSFLPGAVANCHPAAIHTVAPGTAGTPGQAGQAESKPEPGRAAHGSILLRRWRVAAGLTQQPAARLLGCDQSMVCYLELGRRRPGHELAARIEEASKGAVPVESWGIEEVRVERVRLPGGLRRAS
jgi:hypothetical protein